MKLSVFVIGAFVMVSGGARAAVVGGVADARASERQLPLPVRAAAAPAAPSPPPAKPAATDKDASACRKLPSGKRIVKLTLKPETELGDLIAWISSITCKQFIVPGTIPVGKKVTIFSPQLITASEAYRLFLSALDTVGLTVYPSPGGFLRVIETNKAKSSPIPLYIDSPSAGSDESARAD